MKRKVQNKSFNDSFKIKEKHSKVKSINHKVFQMQNYLLPNNLNIEIECIACSKENKNQEPVLQCNEILQVTKEYEINEIPKYEKLQNGDVSNQYLKYSQVT